MANSRTTVAGFRNPRRFGRLPLEAGRVDGREPGRRARGGGPAGVARAAQVAGVVAKAGDDHEDVAGVRVDRDPLAGPWLAPRHEVARGQRRVEEAGRRESERE